MAGRGWAAGGPVEVMSPLLSSPGWEAGPLEGWWEGVRGGWPGLAKGAFFPLHPRAVPLQGPQGMLNCQLLWESKGAAPGW